MTEIVANEGSEAEAGDEIAFNNLISLKFVNLPSLTAFHLGNRTIKFPSLVLSSHLSHSSSSPRHRHPVAVPAQPTPSPSHAVTVHAVCQTLISLISQLTSSPSHPSRDEACLIRHSVFRYHSLPPSMMESPGSMKEERAAMV
uniref:Uncharacterized protein n=1 Tax=Quercus lobata TaxID=97700 RepID=A0A7N2R194_QUELO